jgi:hypothetical protein
MDLAAAQRAVAIARDIDGCSPHSKSNSLLTTAASNHLRKLNRVAALELADGMSAADGRRSDLIMGWALRLRAARGPNATVDSGDRWCPNLKFSGKLPPQ